MKPFPNQYRDWWQAATDYAASDGEMNLPPWFGTRAFEFFHWCYDDGDIEP